MHRNCKPELSSHHAAGAVYTLAADARAVAEAGFS